MTTIFIVFGILAVLNFLLLKFSCSEEVNSEEAEE